MQCVAASALLPVAFGEQPLTSSEFVSRGLLWLLYVRAKAQEVESDTHRPSHCRRYSANTKSVLFADQEANRPQRHESHPPEFEMAELRCTAQTKAQFLMHT